jgi:Spy/CpxP family protein refolding chaperone
MHSAIKRPHLLLTLLLPSALLLAACDRGDELESPEPLDDRAAVVADGDADGPPRAHADHRGRGAHKVDRLCEKLACTDDQRVQIEGMAQRLRAERPEPSGDRAAAKRALAQAFGGETLAAADLQAYRAAVEPDVDDRDAMIVEAALELHGILDVQQRATLAEKIEHKGLPFVGGRGHGHGGKKHHDAAGGDRPSGDRPSKEDRGIRRAERLCEGLACSEEQKLQLAELLQERPAQSGVPKADREALAQAFGGETLAEAAVTAYLEAATQARAQADAAFDARVIALHGMLTPTQRAALLERIAAKGPRALGLGGGGKGKHGHHGKGGKGHHGKGGKKGKHGGRHGVAGESAQFG